MPLLHIAGVSGINNAFFAAFCFLTEENPKNYSWALETLSSFFTSHKIPTPDVLLTNCKLALMNATSTVFPNSIHILCTWKIDKNILTNTVKFVKNAKEEKDIMFKWS